MSQQDLVEQNPEAPQAVAQPEQAVTSADHVFFHN